MTGHRSRKKAAVFLSAIALLSACGSSPTDTPAAPAAGETTGESPLQAVYDAVDGLSGQERFDTLLELARQEESDNGPLNVYHFGEFPDEIEAFQEQTGLQVVPFASTDDRVAERVANEHRAGQATSSVTMTGFEALFTLRADGAIADLESPMLDSVGDDFKGEAWVSPMGIMLVPGYNTDGVAPEDVPTSWENFFTDFDGRIAVELTGWKWFRGLVTHYFVEQKGMTQEDAIALITEGLQGAYAVDGNTLMANLLASGQYDIAPAIFAHHVARLQGEGAPVTFDGIPPDMPPFFTTTGMALTAGGPNPAAGLLFIEFMLSETAQTIIASRNYVPSSDTYQGRTLLDDFPNAIPLVVVPEEGETVADVQREWASTFEVLLRDAGTAVVEE